MLILYTIVRALTTPKKSKNAFLLNYLREVLQFIDAVNAHHENPRKSHGSPLTPFDLSPFDESALGYKSGGGGGQRPAGFVPEPERWNPKVTNPKPINCRWSPDVSNSSQKIEDVGLCDGAELQTLEMSFCVG